MAKTKLYHIIAAYKDIIMPIIILKKMTANLLLIPMTMFIIGIANRMPSTNMSWNYYSLSAKIVQIRIINISLKEEIHTKF